MTLDRVPLSRAERAEAARSQDVVERNGRFRPLLHEGSFDRWEQQRAAHPRRTLLDLLRMRIL